MESVRSIRAAAAGFFFAVTLVSLLTRANGFSCIFDRKSRTLKEQRNTEGKTAPTALPVFFLSQGVKCMY